MNNISASNRVKPEPITFVLGPSGAGKTTLGEYLAKTRSMLHLDFDPWAEDGVDREGLRSEWDAFILMGQPHPLGNTVRRRIQIGSHSGAIITCPSRLVLPAEFLTALEPYGYQFVILWGTRDECRASFLAREKTTGRDLGKDHWDANNRECCARFSHSKYSKYQLTAFENSRHRPLLEIAAEMLSRFNT